MKIIYLLPWEKVDGSLEFGSFVVKYRRREFNTDRICGEIAYSIPAGRYCNDVDGRDYATFEEAAAMQDKWYLGNGVYKYYLIPEDQVKRFEEKLKLLL